MEIIIVIIVAIVVFARPFKRSKPWARMRSLPRVYRPTYKPKPHARRTKENWNRTPPPIPMSLEIKGRCHVIDGDTIIIKGMKIRLAGIDAPELNEAYGQNSKWAMVKICTGLVITAKLTGETSHDRLVGVCYLPDGQDIGAELIKQGLAVDWPKFSGGKYRHLEPAGIRGKLRRPPYNA